MSDSVNEKGWRRIEAGDSLMYKLRCGVLTTYKRQISLGTFLSPLIEQMPTHGISIEYLNLIRTMLCVSKRYNLKSYKMSCTVHRNHLMWLSRKN